eukprot:NODE_2805_length_2141_cov_9.002483.p1 GENE.NODE_2805_length_2141_cov_9.002483~~NODE_2805_length_2141_cov_9.002483.p1  ORF type:complete len:388 (+),score=128.20 NODE_2805_length_2141_cov_9.002483:880-2043(+)
MTQLQRTEAARAAQLEEDVERREREIARQAEEIAQKAEALKAEKALFDREARILELRSKNLGFNIKRKQVELEVRKQGITKEAVLEAEEVAKRQRHDLEEEKSKIDRDRVAALRQIEAEKESVVHEKRIVRREKEEAVKVALGLKAPAPSHWRNQNMEVRPEARVVWKQGSSTLLQLLRSAVIHDRCAGRDGTFEVGRVQRILSWRVENPILWRQYCSKAEELGARHTVQGVRCDAVRPPVPEHVVAGMPDCLRWRESFNHACNEVMLWHGTKGNIVDTIARDGFDERVCSLSGMFGAGLYFAQDSCKSGQYAQQGRDHSHWFLLCRVLLGRPFYAVDPMPSVRKAPDGYDSVVFNPGHGAAVGHHREFIVYDRYQAYPEYIVRACV